MQRGGVSTGNSGAPRCLLKNSPHISSADCRGFARRRWMRINIHRPSLVWLRRVDAACWLHAAAILCTASRLTVAFNGETSYSQSNLGDVTGVLFSVIYEALRFRNLFASTRLCNTREPRNSSCRSANIISHARLRSALIVIVWNKVLIFKSRVREEFFSWVVIGDVQKWVSIPYETSFE